MTSPNGLAKVSVLFVDAWGAGRIQVQNRPKWHGTSVLVCFVGEAKVCVVCWQEQVLLILPLVTHLE